MKFAFTFLIAGILLCQNSFLAEHPRNEPHPPVSTDTCFYTLRVPADMDKYDLHPDTFFVRNKACSIHILRLPPWGTYSTYTLVPVDTTKSGDFRKREVSFHDQKKGWMNITDLFPGAYVISLRACGNGGALLIKLRE